MEAEAREVESRMRTREETQDDEVERKERRSL